VKKPDVLIIGGGIIGVSCAAQLAQVGARVTLLEQSTIGSGCSYGNAGWMTPCFAMPLPMPGMMLKSLRWLLDAESPLYIKPQPSLNLLYWLTRFLQSMNTNQAKRSIQGLVELSLLSLEEYKKLNQKYPGAFAFEQKGLLMVGQTEEGVQSAVQEMNLVSAYNVPGQKLSADEIKAMEPALTGPLRGGVYFPAEAHAEPLKTVQILAQQAKEHGAEILENVEVLSFQKKNSTIESLETTRGKFRASNYVLATGSWSKSLANQLELRIPILGGKGYSLIVPKLEPNPKHPIMLIEKKIAITPRTNDLRIAGTLELVDQDFSITPRRVQAIIKGARQFLNLPAEPKIQELWRGLRPCTPDGVPLIGPHARFSNLILACGHQMLGLQSGIGTGILVSEILGMKKTNVDLSIFNPTRF
jgi:D-amino-acid dehydrogenase